MSDHNYLLLNIDNTVPIANKIDKKIIVDYKTIEDNNLINSDNLINLPDFDSLIEKLSNVIKTNTKEIQFKTKTYNFAKPWINKHIIDTILIRDKYYKIHKKYPLNDFYLIKFKYFQRMVFKSIRSSKRKYFQKEINNCKNPTKKLWEILNTVTGKENNKCNINTVSVDNVDITETNEISNSFNNYFVKIGSQLNLTSSLRINDTTYVYTINYPFVLEAVTNIEIEIAIKNLNVNSAVGHDGISAKFLKKFVNELTFVISKLNNNMLNNGTFPNCLKTAIVTPIYKGGH